MPKQTSLNTCCGVCGCIRTRSVVLCLFWIHFTKILCFYRPLIVFLFDTPATDEVLFLSAIPRVITCYHVLSIRVLYSAFFKLSCASNLHSGQFYEVRRCVTDDAELVWRPLTVIGIVCLFCFVLFLVGNPLSLLGIWFWFIYAECCVFVTRLCCPFLQLGN